MSTSVKEAVDYLIGSHKEITREIAEWVLDPLEVATALAKATINTAEHYVLTLLANANPVVTKVSTVALDKEQPIENNPI